MDDLTFEMNYNTCFFIFFIYLICPLQLAGNIGTEKTHLL